MYLTMRDILIALLLLSRLPEAADAINSGGIFDISPFFALTGKFIALSLPS